MDVVDAEGRSVRGEVGELVCRKPFPGMTRGSGATPSATSMPTGGGCRGSGCTGTGHPSTRTATGSCTDARRHDEHRGQADRPGGARVRRRRASRRRGGRGGRRPSLCQGRGGVDLLRARTRLRAVRRARGGGFGGVGDELGKVFRPIACCSSLRFPRRAAPRSCVVRSARRPLERTRVTCPRSRTRIARRHRKRRRPQGSECRGRIAARNPFLS